MEQIDWQSLWHTLETAYNDVRECKGQGDWAVDAALDSILDHLDAAQGVCEKNGAVPVEPRVNEYQEDDNT